MMHLLWTSLKLLTIYLTTLQVNVVADDYNYDYDDYIKGAKDVKISDYPFIVQITVGGKKCDGALIKPKFVLAAAHCVYDKKPGDITVRAGATALNSGGEVRKVSKINVHKLYRPKIKDNDVAVLTLTSPYSLGCSINTIDLPAGDCGHETFFSDSAIVLGWGRVIEGGSSSPTLKAVTEELLMPYDCRKSITNMRGRLEFCAGGTLETKPCHGHTGAPIILDEVLIGLSAVGAECGSDKPELYTNLNCFVDFINGSAK